MALDGLWQVAFPDGGSYDARGWVPRETVVLRVALFLALFLCVWCVLLLVLKALHSSEKLHGVGLAVWALKGMIVFHHAIAGLWALSVVCGDSVLWQTLSFGGGQEEARRMLVVHPERGTESAAFLVPFTVAYMVADLVLFPCWAKDSETLLFIFHHLFSIFLWSEGLRYDCGQRYAVYLIGTELTGPYLVFRWMLSQVGMKTTMLYYVNGTIFTLLFMVVRVVPILAILRSTVLYFPLREPWKVDPPSLYIRTVQIFGCLAIYLPLLLNAYWAVKVVKGYAKAVQSAFKSGDETKEKKKKGQ
uniref:TLC domain-containing protein n=1 Tax=Alexandrium catenella TaxID=2925 RepID=A0A7S1KYE9_ALECA|mmetsp:Transcript_102689/g.273124  ORF Transcript_102689/g.273124 Transcript_102689/m.273124 type:complete len:303 (+) Transcript_102689:70-978(+)